MELSYFIVICEEIDMFDGLIVHVNEKAKDIEEVHQIVKKNINKYQNATWKLFPCGVAI